MYCGDIIVAAAALSIEALGDLDTQKEECISTEGSQRMKLSMFPLPHTTTTHAEPTPFILDALFSNHSGNYLVLVCWDSESPILSMPLYVRVASLFYNRRAIPDHLSTTTPTTATGVTFGSVSGCILTLVKGDLFYCIIP